MPPTLGAWSLSHWTTRQVPSLLCHEYVLLTTCNQEWKRMNVFFFFLKKTKMDDSEDGREEKKEKNVADTGPWK